MAEQNRNMTDEALSQQLRRSSGGKWGGRLLSLLGVVIAVAGILLDGNLVLIVVGGIVLALGQAVQSRSKEQTGQQAFDAMAPGIAGTVLENVQMNPTPPLLNAEDTNICLLYTSDAADE